MDRRPVDPDRPLAPPLRSIARMKEGVMLVNTSRGTLVATEDLVAALESGRVSAAAMACST